MGKENLGYCGIDCKGFCIMGTGKMSQQARELKKNLEEFEVEHWKDQVPTPEGEKFDFKEFLKGLEWVQKNTLCPGCKKGGGPPECRIRKCSQSKKLEGCWDCQNRKACKELDKIESWDPRIRGKLEKIRG
ncbi:MAG: DUF3795 domain-containing protein [Candidatus Aenigmatarchaeota archaeon]